ncbi:MAG: F0F1 ATP synthase subunit gamma, partial [Clostridia bacterium]|nr:F0F1 ATP synthase subunit gamma [Clostridia bacterium]
MPTIQNLKKQLRGIRSTRKLTKAMKTVSTVKFSKLNSVYTSFAPYGRECEKIYGKYEASFVNVLSAADPDAPALVVVMAANKGMCGSFNTELLNYALLQISEMKDLLLVTVGKKASGFFKKKGFDIAKEYIFDDVPSYEEASMLLDDIALWRSEGKVSKVIVIYQKYVNMMLQKPSRSELFAVKGEDEEDFGLLFAPDRDSVISNTAMTVFGSMVYQLVLENAIGAQAATLMTMRSAFDTATEYCEKLEGEINRLRQSAVTADVIETSG